MTTQFTEALSASAATAAVLAVFAYAGLRFMARNPGSGPAGAGIARHAGWISAIAFLLVISTGPNGAWLIDPASVFAPDGTLLPGTSRHPGMIDGTRLATLVLGALAPAFVLVLIYVIGWHTWPKQAGPVRRATLQVRRVSDYLPRRLTWFFAACSLLSLSMAAAALARPGLPPQPAGPLFDAAGLEVGHTSGTDGLLPGHVAGPYFLAAIVLLIAATALLLVLAVRRPPLGALDAHGNDTLRRIWVNRLLRTGSWAVLITGGASLNYIDTLVTDLGPTSPLHLLSIASNIGQGLTLVAMAVLVPWAPPKLAQPFAVGPAPTHPQPHRRSTP